MGGVCFAQLVGLLSLRLFQLRTCHLQGLALLLESRLRQAMGVVDGQSPQACHNLSDISGQFGERECILQPLRKTLPPEVQHARDGIRRTRAETGTDLFHGRLVAGNDQRVCGAGDLVLGDAASHGAFSSVWPLPGR